MQAIADLEKQWREQARFRRVSANLALEPDGVILGANTVLAKRAGDGALESDNARTLTLLAVAYGKPIEPSILRKFSLASKHAHSGNEAMAAMHIALVGLPVLSDDAARRLFIADGLIEKGIAPRDVWTALEFDPAPLDALENTVETSLVSQKEVDARAANGHMTTAPHWKSRRRFRHQRQRFLQGRLLVARSQR